MSDALTDRLNRILRKITSDEFLSGKGLGNEIAFYIFEYLPEEELRIRDHIRLLLDHIPKHKPGMRVSHVNLFDMVIDYMKERNLLQRSFAKQLAEGDEALLKALRPAMKEEKTAEIFVRRAQPDQHDLVLVSGVGNAWPLLRSHTLLNNLQPLMGRTPLVMFYPGGYDGKHLRLFGKLKNNYYRAFRLIP